MLSGLLLSLKEINLSKLRDLALVGNFTLGLIGIQFFNLGGVPPLAGFLVKLTILKSMLRLGVVFLRILVIMSMVVLFVYTGMFLQAYCVRPRINSSAETVKKRGAVLVVMSLILIRGFRWVIL